MCVLKSSNDKRISFIKLGLKQRQSDLITQGSDINLSLRKSFKSNIKMYKRIGFLICLVLSEMLIFIDGLGILIEL